MNFQKARELRNFLVDARDQIGGSDDELMVEYYGDRYLPHGITVGEMIDLLECFMEPIET